MHKEDGDIDDRDLINLIFEKLNQIELRLSFLEGRVTQIESEMIVPRYDYDLSAFTEKNSKGGL